MLSIATFILLDKAALSNCISPHVVLPLLNYCSCVWDPYQTTYINMIEGVQKFTARLATKQWNTSYLLVQLGWPLLSTRRKQQKLFLCHHILSGYSIIPPSSFTPHPSPTLRHSHHLPLYRPVTRSTAYSASFFPSVPLWNNLPRDTCNCRVSMSLVLYVRLPLILAAKLGSSSPLH